MSSILVYDVSPGRDLKKGMIKAAELVKAAMDHEIANPPEKADPVINGTLRNLINGNPAGYEVWYIHTDTNEYKLELDGNDYKYDINPGGAPNYKKLKVQPYWDKESNGTTQMHISVSRDAINFGNPYLKTILTDVGGKDDAQYDNRKYVLGTITYRRCR